MVYRRGLNHEYNRKLYGSRAGSQEGGKGRERVSFVSESILLSDTKQNLKLKKKKVNWYPKDKLYWGLTIKQIVTGSREEYKSPGDYLDRKMNTTQTCFLKRGFGEFKLFVVISTSAS